MQCPLLHRPLEHTAKPVLRGRKPTAFVTTSLDRSVYLPTQNLDAKGDSLANIHLTGFEIWIGNLCSVQASELLCFLHLIAFKRRIGTA